MSKKLLGIFALGLLMSLGAGSAKAQDNGKISVFAGYSWTTNNIDSSIENFAEEYPGATTGLSGYTASAVYNFTNNVGLEANFDGHNGSPTVYSCTSAESDCNDGDTSETYQLRQDLYTYTFGPKFTAPVGNWAIWGHVLVGGVHAHEGFSDHECYTEEGSLGSDPCEVDYSGRAAGNGFALKAGGGLDWNHGHWGIRLVEVDYVHLSVSATGQYDYYPASYKFPVSANNVEVATGILFNFGK